MAISIANRSVDDIYMDTDAVNGHIKKIKQYLSNINNDLVELRKIYQTFANDSKTKGKMKRQAENIVTNCVKYIKANEAVKIALERQLSKSAAEYAVALTAFDELDALADDLGN